MSDSRETYKTLDLALRVGEILLSSGAGSADVVATMQSITHHLGLRGTDIDLTFTSLRMSYQSSFEEPPVMVVRTVRHRDLDYDDLTRVNEIVTRLLLDDIDRDEARTAVARVVSTGHRRARWSVTIGWGLTGAGISILLGGTPLVISIAFLAACGIDLLKKSMSKRRLPSFYQQVAGGGLATLFAVGTEATNLPVNASIVVTASIIMLLAGVGFLGAIQDALTGFYITSGARLLEALLATAGIIAGVSGGLAVAPLLGVELGQLEPGAFQFSQLPPLLLGAGLSAAAFAFSAYAPWRTLLWIALIAGVGEAIFWSVATNSVGRAWAAAAAAFFVGLVSYSVASKARVPPLVIVVPGIIPFLPGLSIYRGLAFTGQGDVFGIYNLATAAAISIALSSGVILGEYVAQPLRREVRRLEDRLSGPRLVGPIRARAVRRR